MNDLSFIEFIAQSYNSSPDWIKFVWVFGFSAIVLALIICITWLTIRWRELTNERLAIKTNRQSSLEEHEKLKQVSRFYSDDLPWHIKRQENELPANDIEGLDTLLLENQRQAEAEAEKMQNTPDNNDHECSENAIKPLTLAPETSAAEAEPTPNAPEPITTPPPFPYKDNGGNSDDSDDENADNTGNPKNRKAVKVGKTP